MGWGYGRYGNGTALRRPRPLGVQATPPRAWGTPLWGQAPTARGASLGQWPRPLEALTAPLWRTGHAPPGVGTGHAPPGSGRAPLGQQPPPQGTHRPRPQEKPRPSERSPPPTPPRLAQPTPPPLGQAPPRAQTTPPPGLAPPPGCSPPSPQWCCGGGVSIKLVFTYRRLCSPIAAPAPTLAPTFRYGLLPSPIGSPFPL